MLILQAYTCQCEKKTLMANWAVLGATNVQGLPWRPSLTTTSIGNFNVHANLSNFLINIPSWPSITSNRRQRVKPFMCNSVPIERLPNENDCGAHKSERKALRELCGNAVPGYILDRIEEVGFAVATDVQEQALPVVLSGVDCIIHAQTGSGKTLAYLLAIFAVVDARRTAVQALIVVPTRELGMQVTKAARLLAASYPKNVGLANKESINVMPLLDGGSLNRQKIWLKAEPPQIMVATLGCLCQLLEKEILKLDAIKVLVTDEVDSIFGAAKQTYLLRKLLTSYTSINNRQTIFASASIPQHRQFIDNCIQQKWTKRDVVHVHVHPIEPMPSRLSHRYITYQKDEKLDILASLLQVDTPKSGIIFVNKQELRKGNHLLVATDIAARGLDLPETSHIYNFDLPKSATDYLHRAGRTGRKPFSNEKSLITNLITTNERFVLERIENELSFTCEEITL
ncbi:DEAD-box ATP-dependent RNA helicase 58, chloroplastic isoform X2 [Cryptomeria japonica]|uniref:DEAD-box ATP-dependent RNA helicase 58, chloroplastic isoform X2 n=1 Tax=Cryptomeria japonica TaxID=3369 RepID=UPI0027DAA1B1|nr:DEAD-box ATP-dependent RNA helicase 58, chloroplastic isoform X2 [Cryptomeria japonica]